MILYWCGTRCSTLPANYFDRFKLYAKYVKPLYVHNTFWLDTPTAVWIAYPLVDTHGFQPSPIGHLVLPNLSAIFLRYENALCRDMMDAMPNSLEWLKLFLVPSLTCFDLCGDYLLYNTSTMAQVFELVRTAIQKCSELERLAFPLERLDGSHLVAVTPALESLPISRKLSFFKCYSAALSPVPLRFIQNISYLNKLRLPGLWMPSNSV
ncbi:hypothetical protein FRC08_004670 [Ceratobasidium sp. 394]|nr:hypothetical protein FRC08_004670 [Ceratobasidium sp. 394]